MIESSFARERETESIHGQEVLHSPQERWRFQSPESTTEHTHAYQISHKLPPQNILL